MICDWIQGDYSPSEGHNQQTQTNDQIPHHPSIYHNRNRKLLHIILLLIAILIKCCAVAADTTEPPDCSDIVCDLNCPVDSKVVRIDSYDPIILVVNASEVPPPPITETVPVIKPKRKRAIPARRRESITIMAGASIRHRREANDSSITAQKCCECKCDFAKCPEFECPPNEYKITVSQASKIPGSCCQKFQCHTQKPTCYSRNLQKYFNGLEHWSEDSCTHCECSETGETNCETSVCKALSCEKKRYIEGECCPVCDISDSKFCEPDIDCDRHCRNGFERDPVRDCAICMCAKSTSKTTEKTTMPMGSEEVINSNSTAATVSADAATSTESPIWSTDTSAEPDFIDNMNASATKPINDDDSWYVHLPIVLGICITIGAFTIIVCLTCRHLSHKKDKHHLNRKQNTPLI